MQHEEDMSKDSTRQNKSPEKARKVSQTNNKFIDTLIGQWSKRMGIQTILTQGNTARDNITAVEEVQPVSTSQEHKIQILQKKLRQTEESTALLSTNLEAELHVEDEILEKLNSTWEAIDTIINYYNYVSESIKGFQQHVANLTKLYDNIKTVQVSVVEKQQQQLTQLINQDAEQKKFVEEMGNKMLLQEKKIGELSETKSKMEKEFYEFEKRIHELLTIKKEMEEKIQNFEKLLYTEKDYLLQLHNEEKIKLMNEKNIIALEKDELRSSLKKIEEENRKLIDLQEKTELHNVKLANEVSLNRNRIKQISSQNIELDRKLKEFVQREENERKKEKEKEERREREKEENKKIEREREKATVEEDEPELKKGKEKEVNKKSLRLQNLRRNIDSKQELENSLSKGLKITTEHLETLKDSLPYPKYKLGNKAWRNITYNDENMMSQLQKSEERQIHVEDQPQMQVPSSERTFDELLNKISSTQIIPTVLSSPEEQEQTNVKMPLTQKKFFKLKNAPLRRYENKKNKKK